MRLALISDIHGNAVALRAVLDDIERVGVDRVICLGDVATLGPEPAAAVELVAERCCTLIEGNHEQFLLEPGSVHDYTDVAPVVQAIEWCADTLHDDHLAVLRRAADTAFVPLDDVVLFAFHGTPRSNRENLLASSADVEVDAMLDGRRSTIMAGGHTHLPLLRRHRGDLVINPGSVGMPFAEFVGGGKPTLRPCAEYAVIEDRRDGGGTVRVDLRQVCVDHAQLVRATRKVDYPFAEVLLDEYARF